MREIKFRAWDTLNENMFIPCLSEYNDMNDEIGNLTACGRYKLMQYTGAKDKNNKNIYEGDIVFLKNWNDHIPKRFNIPLHETREVSFNEGCFTLVELGGTANCCISYMSNKCAEIRGNIHENPELLKDRK